MYVYLHMHILMYGFRNSNHNFITYQYNIQQIMHTQTNIHTYEYPYTCKYVTRKNYKHCSTKTTMVTSQYVSQIGEAQIYSKSHNNNIFIHERRRTFNKQPRFIHKNRHPLISPSMRLPTSIFSRRWQKLKIIN